MNRLAQSTSPYLLQHADNPVDWYPWGAEALELARREDKPILLSIGYAACHWCHVMAHESFEDAETARLMNELFVNIKVDREERPDIDSIYMQAVQAMTGHGGWPMTMFLTPQGVPYYGGTYFPPADRHGMPSFRKILTAVGGAWREQRGKVEQTVTAMQQMYIDAAAQVRAQGLLDAHVPEMAQRGLARRYDLAFGGFDSAPKFPPTMALEFLLRHWSRTGTAESLEMVHETFMHMARGGIYDQIGGGFARYSVDGRWLVPHFEKMLYDNAQLIRLGAHLYQATRDSEVRRVTEQTIRWAQREMLMPGGGFCSSYDADSEGEEGRFYVWSEREIDELLGENAAAVKVAFGVTPEGNFEGHNILHWPAAPAEAAGSIGITESELMRVVEHAASVMYAARSRRVWPGRDDKIIASWNGLMVRALADAARAFDEPAYASMATQCAEFLFGNMIVQNDAGATRVFRSYNKGSARIHGFLEDHAAFGLAAIAMYEISFDERWLQRARELAATCLALFWDAAPGKEGARRAGRFYDTAHDQEELITRPRDITDNAVPSGNSLAAELLLLTADYFDDSHMRSAAEAALTPNAEPMQRFPTAFGQALCATDTLLHGTTQFALVGDATSAAFAEMLAMFNRSYIAAPLMAAQVSSNSGSALPLLAGKDAAGRGATAYVCRGYVCDAPAHNAAELEAILLALSPATSEGEVS